MNKIVLKLIILMIPTALFANNFNNVVGEPDLIEFNIDKQKNKIKLSPDTIKLSIYEPYVLLINNLTNQAYKLNYNNFGASINPKYFSGSSFMDQTGFTVQANSKITWVFNPSVAGKFEFKLTDLQTGELLADSMIWISDPQIANSDIQDDRAIELSHKNQTAKTKVIDFKGGKKE